MGVLDAVLSDTGRQLGISNNSAGSLLSGLLSFINQEDGGLGAFLDRFRKVGSGSTVSSWLAGDAQSVSAYTVENALGHQTIEKISAKAGLSFSTAASAIALMLPRLIQRLSAGGSLPTRLPAEIMSYITAPGAAVASGVRTAISAAESLAPAPSTRRYLWPLLALFGLAALLVLWVANRQPTVTEPVFNLEEQVRLASQRASAALSALRPGFTARDLTNALNLQVINFSPGSAQIPADSVEFLNRAATAFQSAPAGSVVEVAGHTDNTGDTTANQTLSQQRAEAVRNHLVQQGVNPAMLTARGYGDTRPVSTNDTAVGRFHNRRIEFAVR
jgi:outer membrane protein OmpA-like peptidoglycan-associated protein/uncharacterized protein YidB (DUF937 family)